MSRFSFKLQARPIELQQAVNGLERKRREWKEEPLSFQGFVQELPKIPKDKLKKMKLRKSAQELLPYILIESNLEPSILNALFLLIESKCTQFSQTSRERIFAFGLQYPQIRKIGYQFFKENPPVDSEPRWIRLYWKRIFRPEDPIASMVLLASEERVPMIQLVDWLAINPYVQWIDELLYAYSDGHQLEWLRDCDFGDVYSFIHSSAPQSVRSCILVWILNTYCQEWSSWNEVPGPYRLLVKSAIELWGNPSRMYWKQCMKSVLVVGDWASKSS